MPKCAAVAQARMEETRALFRDAEATQFVIVTIPTAMAAAESARLAKALLQQQVLPGLMAISSNALGLAGIACLCAGLLTGSAPCTLQAHSFALGLLQLSGLHICSIAKVPARLSKCSCSRGASVRAGGQGATDKTPVMLHWCTAQDRAASVQQWCGCAGASAHAGH